MTAQVPPGLGLSRNQKPKMFLGKPAWLAEHFQLHPSATSSVWQSPMPFPLAVPAFQMPPPVIYPHKTQQAFAPVTALHSLRQPDSVCPCSSLPIATLVCGFLLGLFTKTVLQKQQAFRGLDLVSNALLGSLEKWLALGLG